MFSDAVWAELGRSDLKDFGGLLSRFVLERCAGNTNPAIDNLMATLDTLRVKEVQPLLFQQVGEFMESVGEPPPMFADGLIPDKSLILWSGKAKFGKSLACYQLVFDVAMGKPIFGQFQCNKQGSVLYIGMEDGKHEVNRRLRNFGIDPANRDIQIFVSTDWRDYGLQENVDALREVYNAMEPKPTLVLIDTLTESFDCVRDWNDRNAVKKAFRALRTFAQENCTVIGIIHNVKGNAEERESGDEIAGSLAVLSSVDGYLSCYKRRKLDNGNLQLFVRGGGRGGISPGEFIIEMDTETYHWRWLSTDEEASAQRAVQHEARKKLWDKFQRAIIAKDGKATVADIAAHVNVSEAYARTIVREMLGEGVITLLAEKRSNGAGKPAPVYGLPTQDNNNETEDTSIETRYYSPPSEPLKTFFNAADAEEI